MLPQIANFRTFLLAIFLIMAGSGFLLTLTTVRLNQNGVSVMMIGLAATAYFVGLMCGAMRAANVIASVGHIRAFTVFVSMLSASSLAYAVDDSTGLWIALRFINGLMLAGIFVCLESWLNERVTRVSRSAVLACYMVALYSGQAAGQLLLNVGSDAPALPFMFSAILLSFAVLPVAFTKLEQPKARQSTPLSMKRLYAASPLGVAGMAAAGVMLGAFYALGPLFAQRLGMGLSEVALFTFCVIAGGVILQFPLGILSDRFDRRTVIVSAFFAAAITCGLMVLFAAPGVHIFVLGVLFGGISFALYPLCVAHMNDQIASKQRVAASGGLLLVYALGAIAGPIAGSLGVASLGAAGLFVSIGATALAITVFGIWRIYEREPIAQVDYNEALGLAPAFHIDISTDEL